LEIVAKGIEYPLYVHCLSGKDRTGIVIASFLELLGIPRECIVQEYLLSDGHVEQHMIETALEGITPVDSTFKRIDFQRAQTELLRNVK
jgi:protein-tyrosine phosphatase